MMMMIALKSRAHKGEKERSDVKGKYGGTCGNEEGDSDYEGAVQPCQQHVVPSVKWVE